MMNFCMTDLPSLADRKLYLKTVLLVQTVAEGGQNDTCNGGCRTRRQVVSST